MSKVATVVLANSNNNNGSNALTAPKKEAAEPKTTHVIKTNARKSNVRCVSSPNPFPVAQATGVRLSRRLQGVEPETIKLNASKSHQKDQKCQLAADIETVFGPSTKIEEPDVKSIEEENLSQQKSEVVNGNCRTKEHQFVVPVVKPLSSEPIVPTKIAQTKTIVESNEIGFNFELDSDDVEKDVDVKESCKKIKIEPIKDDDVFIPPAPVCERNVQTTRSTTNEAQSSSSSCGSDDPVASTSATAKPKKKIFFNRSRNKVEFNTKSFFASETKDEFDLEGNSEPAPPPAKNKKKELDEDNYLKLKRIRKAHQCHDSGETEQFDEDIKYYLSGIISSNPVSMRCLRYVS